MTVYEKIAASPEKLGAFLASLTAINTPWEDAFHKAFCTGCRLDNCDEKCCPFREERNNPTWWLNQPAEDKREAAAQAENIAAWRNGRLVQEPEEIIQMQNEKPLRVHIRALRNGSPLGEVWSGENTGTRLEAVWQTVEEVKKVHPNAEISVEVEV